MARYGIVFGLFLSGVLGAATPAGKPLELVPKFSFVADGWLSSPQVQVMDAHWANLGLVERGTNYALTGGPKCDDCRKWERYNPDSALFQSWMGVLVLKGFEFSDEWETPTPRKVKKTTGRVMDILAATQVVWLKNQGAQKPKADVMKDTLRVTDWTDGYLRLVGTLATQIDLGEENPKRGSLPKFGDKLRAKVDSFQPIELTYQVLMKYRPETKNFVVIYTALPVFTAKDGELHLPSPQVDWDLARMAAAVTF